MRDPLRDALKADAKAWPLGILLIVLYLTLGGSSARGDNVFRQSMEEADLYTRPVSVSYHGLHKVSQ